jgi:hypothetical protein
MNITMAGRSDAVLVEVLTEHSMPVIAEIESAVRRAIEGNHVTASADRPRSFTSSSVRCSCSRSSSANVRRSGSCGTSATR